MLVFGKVFAMRQNQGGALSPNGPLCQPPLRTRHHFPSRRDFAHKLRRRVRQTEPAPSRYRWLSLSPTRARPPATTRAIQLTHIGIDQSPMMTDQSITIRARWASATTAKITPATRENAFASMSRHPRFRTQDSTPKGGGCERGANDLVTKMVTNGSPRTGIERHELARPATFPNTNQHLRG